MPEVGIDLTGQLVPTLTQPELKRLLRLMQTIHALHSEGTSEDVDTI